MANVVPLEMTFTPTQLATLDIHKLNRWLKDALARTNFSLLTLISEMPIARGD
jgi:hypothetical protein